MSTPLLEMRGISKSFGPTQALKDVCLAVRAGEVRALIGENGAGKSTLLKVLSGAHLPDEGSMSIEGQPYQPKRPSDARQNGVAMIYQELNLAPELSVEDNILLGQRGTGGGLLFRRRQRDIVRRSLTQVGLENLDPTAIVGEQSVATQQLIEIARALASDARLILFDEPTSSLPARDVRRLFEIITSLRDQNLAIIYISHFLEEVREVSETYSVLRDGRDVGEGRIDEVSDQRIVSLMVGRDVDDLFPSVPHQPGEAWVAIDQLSGTESPNQVSVQLRKGEIFGVAGLVGAGRTELLRCLFGLDRIESGTVSLAGKAVRGGVAERMRRGFGLLSEDRKNEGLAQELSIVENITLGKMNDYTTAGLINLNRRRQTAESIMRQMEVKAHTGLQSVSELSGGNQQKVAIARILHQQSSILMLDEPTKGIDVGTKAEIYRLMGQLAAEGRTIVFVSSYLPELLAVCDRIGVMARGQLRAVKQACQWTEDDVMAAAIALDEPPPEIHCQSR